MKHLHPTLSGGTVQTPPGRLQSVIGNLLLTLNSISFHIQFQFHCDKQLKNYVLSTTSTQQHQVQTQAHKNSHLRNAKCLVLLLEIQEELSRDVQPQKLPSKPSRCFVTSC